MSKKIKRARVNASGDGKLNTDVQTKTSQFDALNQSTAMTSADGTIDNSITATKSSQQSAPIKKLKIKSKRKRTPISKAERIDVDVNVGLSTQKAEERYVDGLSNIVENKTTKSIFSIFANNLFTFFNLLGAIVFVVYIIVGASPSNYIFVAFFATNTIIGIVQEIRAKISTEKLSLLQAPTTIIVRDGVEVELPSSSIVLDDIFKLSIGNQIPVDSIVKHGQVSVNESLLTGESVPIVKNVGDLLMAGSFITSGSCYARADKVGNECYVQKLTAKAKTYKKPHSELMQTLKWIIRIVGFLIVPIAFGIGLVNVKNALNNTDFVGNITSDVVTRTGSVIVGMIPSGLVLLTTVALCLGVVRLHKNNTLVQDMYSLEMLARVDVLCLDKTGTITDGRMKVIDTFLFADKHPRSVNDIVANLQNVLNDNNQTAIALRDAFSTDNAYTATKLLPFSSDKKYSAVTFNDIGTYAIGAPEFILKEIPDNVKMQIDRFAHTGNRVLLLTHSNASITAKECLPSAMKPIALIILSDNIRDEAISTIKWFKDNEVNVKVISGDNPITVSEIAKRAGIENASNWISLEGLSDKEVASIADKYTVFGRVTPDQKAVLIKSMKMVGHTVAMTGDGVNDILAMREADCSVTVASGADSAKSIAHIILADNNFNSIPKVVAEGRRVINNIKQSASLYLMKTIFITVLALISILFSSPFPFKSGMLTILEFAVIGVPSIFLSLQPNDKRVEGNFLSTIFGNAIPGALTLLLNVYIIKFLNLFGIFGTDEQLVITLQVVAFTLGGLTYLFNICKPFNTVRVLLVTFVSILIGVWIVYLLDTSTLSFMTINFFELKALFPLTGDNWKYIVLLIAIVEMNIPFVDKAFSYKKVLPKAKSPKDKIEQISEPSETPSENVETIETENK